MQERPWEQELLAVRAQGDGPLGQALNSQPPFALFSALGGNEGRKSPGQLFDHRYCC